MDRKVGELSLIDRDSRWSTLLKSKSGEAKLPDNAFANYMKSKGLGVTLTRESGHEYILFADGSFWLTGNVRYIHV